MEQSTFEEHFKLLRKNDGLWYAQCDQEKDWKNPVMYTYESKALQMMICASHCVEFIHIALHILYNTNNFVVQVEHVV